LAKSHSDFRTSCQCKEDRFEKGRLACAVVTNNDVDAPATLNVKMLKATKVTDFY